MQTLLTRSNGGTMMSKNKQTQKYYAYCQDKMNTNNPQLAALKGISTALHLAEWTDTTTSTKKELIRPCDCKEAVNIINHQFLVSLKYSKICQQAQEQRGKLTQKHINHNITWVPGHLTDEWKQTSRHPTQKGCEQLDPKPHHPDICLYMVQKNKNNWLSSQGILVVRLTESSVFCWSRKLGSVFIKRKTQNHKYGLEGMNEK